MADRKRPRESSPARVSGAGPTTSPARAGSSSADDGSPPLPPSSLEGFDDDEVVEENVIEDEPEDLEDEGGEDLFGPSLLKDYRENPDKDVYEGGDIDDEEYEAMDVADRMAVEAKLRRRDKEIARREGRLPAAFLDDDDDEDEMPSARRRRRRDVDIEDMEDGVEELPLEDLEDMKGKSITEWITMEGPRQAIRREFKKFLLEYVDSSGTSVYGDRVRHLGEANLESLEISYVHLSEAKGILALFLGNSPAEMLKIFDEVAIEVVLMSFPEYEQIHSSIHVRITDLPIITSLRDLRQNQLNCLVRICGVVTRRSGVFPQLKYVKYDCLKCGSILGPFFQDAQHEIKVGNCPNCQSRGPFTVNSEQTIYRNYQRMTLQESPGSVPAGRLPRHREVILLWDLIDSAKPGEEVEITGVYRNNFDASLNTKNGFPVFATIVEANYVSKREDMFASTRLSEDEIKQIRNLAKDERIGSRIIKSIAPSIFGHEDIKTAIALALFSGVPKDVNGKHRLRGDINVLLLGDPGTAKSQFLKYVEKAAHRAVFTTGKGASAVGLTASVRKDPITREWTLEGGALVLADKGVCLIDEFDKMNDADRTSIHEAMEQQSISISKAGIVTTLQARCAVIAAANPIGGRYNQSIPFSQNVELTEPILSRFDVLCVVKDTVDPVADEQLAKFVIGSHIRSHPEYDDAEAGQTPMASQIDADLIPQDLLRKYIMYARDKVRPKLNNMDQDKLANLYSELRRESLAGGSIPITVRHIESMVRMSEAHAKMHLREYVQSNDIDIAIRCMLESFIGAQKYSVMRSLRRAFSRYITYMRDNDELLFYTLSQLLRDQLRWWQHKHRKDMPTVLVIQGEEFEARAKELSIHDVRPFYTSRIFTQNGYSFNAEQNAITKRF